MLLNKVDSGMTGALDIMSVFSHYFSGAGLAIFMTSRQLQTGRRLILSDALSFLCFTIAFGWIIRFPLLHIFALRSPAFYFALVELLIGAMLAFLFWPRHGQWRAGGGNRYLFSIAVLTIATSLFVWLSWLYYTTVPPSAWDGIDSWFPRAIQLADQRLISLHEAHQYRHSLQLPLILGVGAAVFRDSGVFGAALLPWSVVCAGIIMCAAALCYEASRSVGFSTLCAIVVATVPLLQTHVLLAGYAEIWVAFYLLMAALVFIVFKGRNLLKILFIACFLFFTSTLKVTAVLYILPFVIVSVCRHASQSREGLVLLFGSTIIILVAISTGFLFEVGNHKLGIVHQNATKLFFGGYRFIYALSDPLGVINSIINSLIMNVSFSLSCFFIIAVRISCLCCPVRPRELVYLLDVALVGCALWLLPLMVEPYFRQYAANDIGLTRFALPLVLLGLTTSLAIIPTLVYGRSFQSKPRDCEEVKGPLLDLQRNHPL